MSNFWTKPIFDMTILFPLTPRVKCRVTPSVLGITGNKSAYYMWPVYNMVPAKLITRVCLFDANWYWRVQFLFCGDFSPFWEKYVPSQIPCFFEKFTPKNEKYSPKAPKFCHNCLQYERVLKVFYFQIWLNILMENHYLNNISKLKKKTLGGSIKISNFSYLIAYELLLLLLFSNTLPN